MFFNSLSMLTAGALLAGCGRAPALEIDDAWVRSAPPSATVQAGYFTLHNRAAGGVTIVGAYSNAFGSVEMHETVTSDGVSRMRRIERLVVPGGGSVELAPGGRHLMLIDPQRPYAPRDRLEIVLELDGGANQAISFEVRPAAY